MQNYKTTHNHSALSDGNSTATQKSSSVDSFFDMTDEEISVLAKVSTRAAVKDLHDRGISTYGMRDDIMYETKPNGEKVAFFESAKQS